MYHQLLSKVGIAWRHPGTLWRHLLRRSTRLSLARWLVLGVVAGLGSGLLASLFYCSLEGLKHLLLVHLAGLSPPFPSGENLFHMRVVAANAGFPASTVVNALVADLREFKDGLPLEDDVTLVVIRSTA